MSSHGAEVLEAFERRAARAQLLAPQSPAAEAPLSFAAGLYRAQRELAARLAEAPLSSELDETSTVLLAHGAPLLRYAASGPPQLAEQARVRLKDDGQTARARLLVYWSGDPDARDDYLSRALLKPWVELLAAERRQPVRDRRPSTCPFCGGGPWMCSRRTLPESHGAQRNLICALCAGQWEFPRIRCPACGEASPDKLPSFQNPENSAVRIEACDTCKRYVKSIDLSLDARPIPEVDDLASLALDLWALEQGYQRIEPGLAGI
ncbi:MAG TPA: formate dehydrogenase accessory protein FdhE [Myxococcales bacterium]|nr:formate dehydrogenase accessory protein FdhE [Myxococcales bacterium]